MIQAVFVLLFFHFLADYPLQGDFLAKGKNPLSPIPGVPWYHCLTAHAFIHAGFVAIAMNNLFLGVLEFFAHWVIDLGKTQYWFGRKPETAYNIDQALHVICKLLWVAFLYYGWTPI